MLSILNTYLHGFVAIPVVDACRKAGLFHVLQAERFQAVSTLAEETGANQGHLLTALHMLESLGWVEQDTQGRYRKTPESLLLDKLPQNIVELLSFPFSEYLDSERREHQLRGWLELACRNWDIKNVLFVQFLDGLLAVPLIIRLGESGCLPSGEATQLNLPSHWLPQVKKEVVQLCRHLQWLEAGTDERLSAKGRFFADRRYNFAIALSYLPLLKQMPELLFGDCKVVFAEDQEGREGHLDRTLNVIGSGFQHERYFADLEGIVLRLFDRLPFSEQPRYIADTGCGDGTLLKRIYDIVQTKSRRGAALEQYPLTLLGIDLNQAALTEAALTLSGIAHKLITGDIGNPAQIVRDLVSAGVEDPDDILHVRSFLDHDRPYQEPVQREELASREHLGMQGVFVRHDGSAIPAASVFQSLVEYLRSWSSIVGRHGLVTLEVHSLEPQIVGRYIDKCENLYFDTLQRFSRQLLMTAEQYLLAAAEAGLFPRDDSFRSYPKILPFSRITLQHFERQAYQIRFARLSDLPALRALELKSWDADLRATPEALAQRLTQYPAGQLVLEQAGRVLGVSYTQLISDAEVLKSSEFDQVESLHDSAGSTLQLISVNVLPEMQGGRLGDRLLEFVLQRAGLASGITAVIGVTRCKNFYLQTALTLERYIQLRNSRGVLADPILRFHEQHGAQITKLLPGFRPRDRQNDGCGVLVEYDPRQRVRKDYQPAGAPLLLSTIPRVSASSLQTVSASVLQTVKVSASGLQTVTEFLEATIRQCLGRHKASSFGANRPLMEMGLDSADLLELGDQISHQYQMSLDATFLFEHNSAQKIADEVVRHLKHLSLAEPALPASRAAPASASLSAAESRSASESRSGFGSGSAAASESESASASDLGEQATPSRPRAQAGVRPADIAIIGMSCRLPGAVDTPDAFWNFLKEGRNGISTISAERWVWPEGIDPQGSHRGIDQAGLLDDIASFDAAFFQLSRHEAECMDPQQRILLELS